MDIKKQYEKQKEGILQSKDICEENKSLIKEFLEFEERKLKRTNSFSKLDIGCYRTLLGYLTKVKNINKWFKNKPWKDLTESDIRKVYDDLEDGKIKNEKGHPFKDKEGYYNKCFKSKLFGLAGKREISLKVIEYSKRYESEVRFIEFETFKKLVDVALHPSHKALLWISWDIGENVDSLLKLQKRDFVRNVNPETKESEYIINLPREKLKRSRTPRSEITNFKETVDFLDLLLKDKKPEDNLFSFDYPSARKFLARAVRITNARCIPKGQAVTWKDLRSSMACHLLKEGWNSNEINARLGHKPSSRVLDRYINYLAIGRHKPKKKIYDNALHKIKEDLEESKNRETLLNRRLERLREFDKTVADKLTRLYNFFEKNPKLTKRLAKEKEIGEIFA